MAYSTQNYSEIEDILNNNYNINKLTFDEFDKYKNIISELFDFV